MSSMAWKVGQLAKRAGLSVRTLHYYDQIGLLTPSRRTESGHRLYGREQLERLQMIRSLQQIGLSLEQTQRCLEQSGTTLASVLEEHLNCLRERIELERRLCSRLEALASRLQAAEEISVEQFVQTLEEMAMWEKHYTADQLEFLKNRGEEVGPERIRVVEKEWSEVFAGLQRAMESGVGPSHPEMQVLARQARALIQEFTGGNAGIEASLKMAHQADPSPTQRWGDNVNADLMQYYGQVMSAAAEGPAE